MDVASGQAYAPGPPGVTKMSADAALATEQEPVHTASSLRTPEERTRFALAAAFSGLAWLVLIPALNLYLPFVAIGVIAAHALLLARITGNGVRVGPDQLPDLHRRVERASRRLGLAQPPEAYVVQSGGVLNAFATKLFSRRFIVLYSDLVDACEDLARPDGEPDEVDFIVAHEIGHLAAGHLAWNTFLWPARAVPWLGAAYSRACEYTCDACGHAVVGDLEVSSRALAVLAAGGRLAKRVNLDAFTRQHLDAGRFWMAVEEVNATHPYLPKRVAALRGEPRASRNPLAVLLAPLFSIQAIGMAYVVFLVGVFAAIAIPNFVMMQLKAKRAEVPTHVDAIAAAERAWFAANGSYLACGTEEQAVALVGKEPRAWAEDPAAECFAKLGWQPDGPVRGGYWVIAGTDEEGQPAFVAFGASDVDGDGDVAVYRAFADQAAELTTEENVF